ncbi:ArsR family transcriptional regulator [Halobellus sp. GM3]|uniref:ArsR family transcriptional regulator n=1 Tax=Halobellus sp. GM3 TaxID=3458410 RepID=UPI00403E0B4E
MGGLISNTKLRILRQLRTEPLHGYALAAKLDLSHGYIYTHLRELRDAGMIEIAAERDGKKIYQLSENGQYLVKAFDDEEVSDS